MQTDPRRRGADAWKVARKKSVLVNDRIPTVLDFYNRQDRRPQRVVPALAQGASSGDRLSSRGTLAPKAMPDAIAARLTADIEKILHSTEVREKLAQQGGAGMRSDRRRRRCGRA